MITQGNVSKAEQWQEFSVVPRRAERDAPQCPAAGRCAGPGRGGRGRRGWRRAGEGAAGWRSWDQGHAAHGWRLKSDKIRTVLQGTSMTVKKKPVLRIHDIVVWIRIWIRGSMPLSNGSESWILLFSSLTFKMPTKTNFLKQFFSVYYFLKVHWHHFSKIKRQKESRNSRVFHT